MTVRKKLSHDSSKASSKDMDDSKYPFNLRVASMTEKRSSFFSQGSSGSRTSTSSKNKEAKKKNKGGQNGLTCVFNQIQDTVVENIQHYFGKGCCKELICCTGLNFALFLCALFGGLLVLLLMFQTLNSVFSCQEPCPPPRRRRSQCR